MIKNLLLAETLQVGDILVYKDGFDTHIYKVVKIMKDIKLLYLDILWSSSGDDYVGDLALYFNEVYDFIKIKDPKLIKLLYE